MSATRFAAILAAGLSAGAGLATPPLAQAAPAAVAATPRTITVTGEGRIASQPDMATVTLGVETQGTSANTALAENTAATGQVLDGLRAAGIAPRDMQTSDLTLGPRWSEPAPGQAPRIAGFVAVNMVTITVRDLTALGGVLDAVAGEGATTFQGLAFGLTDPRPTRDEARRAAVADALARAGLYAQAAGVTLGPVLALLEGGGAEPRPMMRMAADATAVPLAPGEVTTEAQVTMEFAIAP